MSELQRPYSHFYPGAGNDNPIWHWIAGNAFGHYAEHRPWLEAIANGAKA